MGPRTELGLKPWTVWIKGLALNHCAACPTLLGSFLLRSDSRVLELPSLREGVGGRHPKAGG